MAQTGRLNHTAPSSFSLTDGLAIKLYQSSGRGPRRVRANIMMRISLKGSQHLNISHGSGLSRSKRGWSRFRCIGIVEKYLGGMFEINNALSTSRAHAFVQAKAGAVGSFRRGNQRAAVCL